MRLTHTIALAAAVAGGALLAGCGDDKAAAPPPPAPAGGGGGGGAAAPSPAPAGGGSAYDPAKATATIKVVATLKGDPKKRKPLDVSADKFCGAAHPDGKSPDESVVAAGGKLANLMAWVSSGAEKWTYKTPTDAVVMDQKGCVYVPHVFTIMVNQPLTIKSSDETMHNVHILGPSELNKAMPKGADDLSHKFVKAEVPAKVKCDVHGWMTCFAGVFTHPFHGVTGADGSVSIKVPAGDYEVSLWHEVLTKEPQKHKVSVKDGETKEIAVEFEDK
jgi:hypothetical protein